MGDPTWELKDIQVILRTNVSTDKPPLFDLFNQAAITHPFSRIAPLYPST